MGVLHASRKEQRLALLRLLYEYTLCEVRKIQRNSQVLGDDITKSLHYWQARISMNIVGFNVQTPRHRFLLIWHLLQSKRHQRSLGLSIVLSTKKCKPVPTHWWLITAAFWIACQTLRWWLCTINIKLTISCYYWYVRRCTQSSKKTSSHLLDNIRIYSYRSDVVWMSNQIIHERSAVLYSQPLNYRKLVNTKITTFRNLLIS